MNLDHTTPTGAPAAPEAPVPATAGTLSCPECGDSARPIPPREWPLPEWVARPAYSHADGTPLCPVIGPHGYQPTEPVRPVI